MTNVDTQQLIIILKTKYNLIFYLFQIGSVRFAATKICIIKLNATSLKQLLRNSSILQIKIVFPKIEVSFVSL